MGASNRVSVRVEIVFLAHPAGQRFEKGFLIYKDIKAVAYLTPCDTESASFPLSQLSFPAYFLFVSICLYFSEDEFLYYDYFGYTRASLWHAGFSSHGVWAPEHASFVAVACGLSRGVWDLVP